MNRSVILLSLLVLMSYSLFAEDFGSAGAMGKSEFTLEEMLAYAIQDEYLALNEYRALIKEFGVDRPYTNIARAEESHISFLEDLYQKYDLSIPDVDTGDRIVLPSSLQEAAEIGVEAEINNIAMYDRFLDQDIPSDVKDVFIYLRDASKNHLRAFERQLERGTAPGSRSGNQAGR